MGAWAARPLTEKDRQLFHLKTKASTHLHPPLPPSWGAITSSSRMATAPWTNLKWPMAPLIRWNLPSYTKRGRHSTLTPPQTILVIIPTMRRKMATTNNTLKLTTAKVTRIQSPPTSSFSVTRQFSTLPTIIQTSPLPTTTLPTSSITVAAATTAKSSGGTWTLFTTASQGMRLLQELMTSFIQRIGHSHGNTFNLRQALFLCNFCMGIYRLQLHTFRTFAFYSRRDKCHRRSQIFPASFPKEFASSAVLVSFIAFIFWGKDPFEFWGVRAFWEAKPKVPSKPKGPFFHQNKV